MGNWAGNLSKLNLLCRKFWKTDWKTNPTRVNINLFATLSCTYFGATQPLKKSYSKFQMTDYFQNFTNTDGPAFMILLYCRFKGHPTVGIQTLKLQRSLYLNSFFTHRWHCKVRFSISYTDVLTRQLLS